MLASWTSTHLPCLPAVDASVWPLCYHTHTLFHHLVVTVALVTLTGEIPGHYAYCLHSCTFQNKGLLHLISVSCYPFLTIAAAECCAIVMTGLAAS